MFQVWINEVQAISLKFIFDYMITLLILKFVIFFIIIALFFLILINFIGMFYTPEKKITITNSFFHTTDALFKTISDIDSFPAWKKEIINVEQNGDTWMEYFSSVEALKYKILQSDPGKNLIITLQSDTIPFNLTRTYTIWHQDYMAFLKIEDQLSITKPYLRVFSSIFYNHSSYLRNLMQSMDFYLENKSGKSTSSFL